MLENPTTYTLHTATVNSGMINFETINGVVQGHSLSFFLACLTAREPAYRFLGMIKRAFPEARVNGGGAHVLEGALGRVPDETAALLERWRLKVFDFSQLGAAPNYEKAVIGPL